MLLDAELEDSSRCVVGKEEYPAFVEVADAAGYYADAVVNALTAHSLAVSADEEVAACVFCNLRKRDCIVGGVPCRYVVAYLNACVLYGRLECRFHCLGACNEQLHIMVLQGNLLFMLMVLPEDDAFGEYQECESYVEVCGFHCYISSFSLKSTMMGLSSGFMLRSFSMSASEMRPPILEPSHRGSSLPKHLPCRLSYVTTALKILS